MFYAILVKIITVIKIKIAFYHVVSSYPESG